MERIGYESVAVWETNAVLTFNGEKGAARQGISGGYKLSRDSGIDSVSIAIAVLIAIDVVGAAVVIAVAVVVEVAVAVAVVEYAVEYAVGEIAVWKSDASSVAVS